jgi:hypothetical protein
VNMHPRDVLASLDKLARTGTASVMFTWHHRSYTDDDDGSGDWEWELRMYLDSTRRMTGDTDYLVGGGTAPTFTEAAYAVFAALERANDEHS